MLYEIAEDLKGEILKYSEDYDIFIENHSAINIDSEKDNINFAKEEYNFGIGVRILNNNKMGFAYSSNIEDYKELAEKAFLNSKLNEMDENFSFALKSKYSSVKGLCDKKYDELEVDDLSEILKMSIDTVNDNGCEATSGGVSAYSLNSLVVNSNGVELENSSTSFSTHIAVNAESGGEKSTYYDSESLRTFNLNPIKLANDVCNLAKNSLGGIKTDTDDKTVVLDYHAASGLLGTFIGAFNGGNVLRGRSILADKLLQEIAPNNLSIYDDGTIDGALVSSNGDNEGISSQKTVLVENGILNGFIYDVYNSNKYNNSKLNLNKNSNVYDDNDPLKQLSTGNGFRSFSSIPNISTTNIVFDFKDLNDINEVKNGILAIDVLGAHTANPISGDFSVEINNPFLIENGEITKPIKKAMLSGNVFDLINQVKGLKSKIQQKGSFIIPQLVCENLRIVG
ncbi:MAG: TldD/PmbA family protein [Methanobrevibacter sp.]|jgi:PmbA protein|nr:TldD/PmbA family protein [Candidatus Methanoflexus mossambicus]